MSVITFEPHHLRQLWAVNARGIGALNQFTFYSDSMQQKNEDDIKAVLKNPKQMVKIVSGLDSLCGACPYNPVSSNYDSSLDKSYCDLVNDNGSQSASMFEAYAYKVEDLIDGSSITSEELMNRVTKSSLTRALVFLTRDKVKSYFSND